MEITGVDFVTVPTTDFEKAGEFYGGVLGLELSKRWGDMPAGEYETGTLTVAIVQSTLSASSSSQHSHPIALRVKDVEAARAEARELGARRRARASRPPPGGR